MDDIFKRVFNKIAMLSDEELRARLDQAAEHPLAKLLHAMSSWSLLATVSIDTLSKHDIDVFLLTQGISYADLVLSDELATNDALFALAA